jgi:hypothetical protein
MEGISVSYQPQDQVPAQAYAQPQPVYGYGQAPAPVVVNVVQNAGPVIGRKRVNHLLHFAITILTGGLWLVVWVPLALKRKRVVVYR